MAEYYRQAEVNKNTPIKREHPTLDGLKKELGWNEDASKGRYSLKPIILDFSTEHCGHPNEEPEPDTIILAGTTGDDYDVLNKVNRNIKAAAVNELAINEDSRGELGVNDDQLGPGNKYWILLTLLFKPVGKYKWSHPVLGEDTVYFDINTEPLSLLISRVFKAGYKSK
jgi:hypothetical protein